MVDATLPPYPQWMPKPEPQVAGESARLIIDTIRSLPLTAHSGRIYVHNTATGEAAAALARACERIELAVITDAANCVEHEEHATLDEHDYRHMVMSALAWKAKVAVGECDRIEALWGS